MEVTLNFDKSNTALQSIFINEPFTQCAVSLKGWFICKILWVIAYNCLKIKQNSSLVSLRVVAVAFESFSLQVQTGFRKGVKFVPTGCLWEWSQVTCVSGLSKGRGQGREDGKKGLTQTSLLDHVVHPDSGRCADWIIYNASWRHTTGIKNFITAYSVNWSRRERKLR